MNKKNNLALFTLFFAGLFSLFTSTVFAQKADSAKIKQHQTSIVKKDILQNYIDISTLQINKRPKAFSDLSNEDKANVFRLHLALQFINRPNLTKNQQDIILETINGIKPDTYDRTKDQANTENFAQTLEARAKSFFSQQEAFEIFANLSSQEKEIEILRKYQFITNLASFPERKTAFKQVSLVEMSNLWKVQLAVSLIKDFEMTASQQDFIVKIINFIEPSFFQETKSEKEKAELEEKIELLRNEALNLFSEENVLIIFTKLGFTGNCELPKNLASHLAPSGDCSCRSGDCSESTVCAGGCCTSTWFGCGFIYLRGRGVFHKPRTSFLIFQVDEPLR